MKTNRLFFVIAVYSFSFCVMGQMKIQNDGQISTFSPKTKKPLPVFHFIIR